MRILAGPGWWRGSALAAWVARAACRGLPWYPGARTRGAAGNSWALDRLYSSAERKVTASPFLISYVLNIGRVLLTHVEYEGRPRTGYLWTGCDSGKEAELTARPPGGFGVLHLFTRVTLDKSLHV